MIQPIGHFRLWRALFNKPIWLKSTLEQKVILITLMSMANFKANQWEWQGKQYNLEPGQFITSLESIKANTGNQVSIQNIRTALKRFEKLEFLTYQSTKEGRLVTLVNWRDYQYVEGEPNIAINKDLTKTQQRPNKDLTTIEEGNKDNKVNNDNNKDLEKSSSKKLIKDKYGEFKKVSLLKEEYEKLINKIGQPLTDDLMTRLDSYKASTGKTYKSDYATILNWARKEPVNINKGDSNGNSTGNDNEDYWGIEKYISRG